VTTTPILQQQQQGRFTLYLEAHGIKHITDSIGKPTTQGKIERFFQTFEPHYPRFNDMELFREYYNNKPLGSLNHKTPSIPQLTVRYVIGSRNSAT
jgi:transposase InsO family protein